MTENLKNFIIFLEVNKALLFQFVGLHDTVSSSSQDRGCAGTGSWLGGSPYAAGCSRHRFSGAGLVYPHSSSRKRPPPELVSPAADLLHPLAGEETALGRAAPGAQRPRDQLWRGVRPLQPRCPRDRRCCPTSPLATLAGDEQEQHQVFLPLGPPFLLREAVRPNPSILFVIGI